MRLRARHPAPNGGTHSAAAVDVSRHRRSGQGAQDNQYVRQAIVADPQGIHRGLGGRDPTLLRPGCSWRVRFAGRDEGVTHRRGVTLPESRGRGVGRLLLEAALAFLKRRGAPRVVLTTADSNEVVERFEGLTHRRRTPRARETLAPEVPRNSPISRLSFRTRRTIDGVAPTAS